MDGKQERWIDLADGRARLGRGDCLALLPEIEAESVDVILADPPYSGGAGSTVGRKASTRSKYTQGKNVPPDFLGDQKDQRSYFRWAQAWLSECWRATREGGVALVFTDWRQLPTLSDALQGSNWIWRGVVVWDKTGACRPQKGRFRQQGEFVLWATKGHRPAKGDPLMGLFRHCNVMGPRRRHQTEKPTALLEDLLAIAPPESVILDPFMGSGSTGEAVLTRGGHFIGLEQDVHYHQVAMDRMKAFSED